MCDVLYHYLLIINSLFFMSKSLINSVKALNEVKRSASAQINALVFSPFFIVNTLNAVASGKVTKGTKELINSGFEVSDIVTLAANMPTGYGKPFSVDMFAKNKGIFCEIVTSKRCPKHGLDLYNVSENGWIYYRPIRCTFSAFINAFANVAKPSIKERAYEAKEAAKAAKAASKVAAKAAKAKSDKELCEKYLGVACASYTLEQYAKKAKLLRQLYGKAA